MGISAQDLAALRHAISEVPQADMLDLSSIQDIPELIAYLIAAAREAGEDELDWIEAYVELSELSVADMRESARVLEPLGYHGAVALLRGLVAEKRRVLKKKDH